MQTREDANNNKMPFLNCLVNMEKDGCLDIEIYSKPTLRDQCLLFDSHHPLKHKCYGIKSHHQAKHVPTKKKGKYLLTCGYSNWAFVKMCYRTKRGEQMEKHCNSRNKSCFLKTENKKPNTKTLLKHIVVVSWKINILIPSG